MENYKIESKKGEGTYSQVFMATSTINSEKYALKIMKHKYVNLTKIKNDKQIKALKMLQHPNIIKLIDVLYAPQDEKMALVFELMDCNLYQFYRGKKNMGMDKIRGFGHEILEAVAYMHSKGIFHRDIKPENILYSAEKGLKLADLGSCKNMHSDLPFTEYISTRWYRAPQCIMNQGFYSQKMDVWAIGCVLFQLYTHYPLFPGKNEVDQLATIFAVLGTPSQKVLLTLPPPLTFDPSAGCGLATLIPDCPPQFFDLLDKMLQLDPALRIDAKEALEHPFFYSLTELKKYRKVVIQKISGGGLLPMIKSKKVGL